MFEDLASRLAPVGFAIGFPIAWSFVCFALARQGGWSELAAAYPAAESPGSGELHRFQGGQLRAGMRYNGVLWARADPRALHLSVMLPFRPGHPPLSLPWDEARVVTHEDRVFPTVELRLARCPDVPVTFSRRLGEKLLRAAHRPLPTTPA